MDKAKLDHLVKVIKKKDGYECQKCGRCCREYRHDIQVTKEDYEELLKFGYDVSHIKENFVNEGRKFYEINEGGINKIYWGTVIRFNGGTCPYLNKETNLCSLHPHEPLICKIYPCTIMRIYPFSEGISKDDKDTKMKAYEIGRKPCLKERTDKGIEEWESEFKSFYVEEAEDQE
jgi:Fe-S-cluster containining protein